MSPQPADRNVRGYVASVPRHSPFTIRRCRAVPALVPLAIICLASLQLAAQTSIQLQTGLNAVAVQTKLGGNTLNELIETPGPIPAETVVLKHDPKTGVWQESKNVSPAGWQPNFSVDPGEGIFVYAPAPFLLTLRGSPAPETPRFTLPAGGVALRNAPVPGPSSWGDAIDGSPVAGDRVFRWNGAGYDAFGLTFSGWTPREPLAQPGESLWFSHGPLPSGPAPVILQQPQDAIVAPGGTARFIADASGIPPNSFQWFRDGVPLETAKEATLTLPSVALADHGARFSVVVSNRFGTAMSVPATLQVLGKVTGRLVRANGRPLYDQPVTLKVIEGTLPTRSFSATTGPNGSFLIHFPCGGGPGRQLILSSDICPGVSWPVPGNGCVTEVGDVVCANALAPAAVPRGLGLWLPFNETNGPVAHNLAGGNDGTHFDAPLVALPGNGPVITNEFVKSGLLFDGQNDQVEVPTYPEIEVGQTDFSLGAWVRVGFTPDQTRTIIDKLEEIGPQEFGYRLALRQGRPLLTLADGTAHDFLSGGQPVLADGRWHLVFVTVERQRPDGLGVIFYVDGVPSAPLDVREVTGSIASKARFIVGGPSREGPTLTGRAAKARPRPASSPSEHWQGGIDEVCEFCRALTRAEIEELVAAGQAGMIFVCLEPITVAVWDATERIRFDVVLPNYSGKTSGANVTTYELTDTEECNVRIPKLPSKSVVVPINGRIEPLVLNPPPALDQAGKESCLGLLTIPFEPITPARRWRYHFAASPNECAVLNPFVGTAPAGTETTFTMAVTNSVPGPSRTVGLRVSAADPRGGSATNVSLNGGAYGVPALISLTFPAGAVGTVAVKARFFAHDPGVYYPVYLGLADETGTNYPTIATALLLNVIPGTRPLAITSQPVDAFVDSGTGVALSVGFAGANGGALLQWRLNGAPLGGETNSTLTLPSVAAANSGFYDCVIIDADGAMLSDSAAVALKSAVGLGIAHQGTDAVLSWPLLLFQFFPESTESLVDPIEWQAIEAASDFDGDLFHLAVPAATGSSYFRLRK